MVHVPPDVCEVLFNKPTILRKPNSNCFIFTFSVGNVIILKNDRGSSFTTSALRLKLYGNQIKSLLNYYSLCKQ